MLNYIKSEYDMMQNRQWIRVQLPDIKSLQIPIKIEWCHNPITPGIRL